MESFWYQSKCRACQREWYKNYYNSDAKEKTRLYANNLAARTLIHELIRESKNKPCADCGGEFPYYVMDFDHRDPKKKTFNVGMFAGRTLAAVRKEIEKCDVVCANCHRERTHSHRLDKTIDV
jgi:hypothetical protein